MTKQFKLLSALSLGSTVVLMYLATKYVLGLQALTGLGVPASALSAIAAGATSVGTYKLLTKILFLGYGKSRWIRKRVLGPDYIEGTWVGHYKHNDLDLITIEFIDQSHEETLIHGREFDVNGKRRGTWDSELISIDGVKRRLIYSYKCNMNDSRSEHYGRADFKLVFQNAGKYADMLDGHSADLLDGNKDPNTEYKVSVAEIPDSTALAKARERFSLDDPTKAEPGSSTD